MCNGTFSKSRFGRQRCFRMDQRRLSVDQIVLGVASYGHSYWVNHAEAFASGKAVAGGALSSSYPAFDATHRPSGDLWDDQPRVDVCGVLEKQG
jgi:chitinase